MSERPDDVSGDPHDLVAGYLLDALDGAELARFQAHLPECAPCRAEVALLLPTVADLAATVEVVPPASLETALLTSLFGEVGTDAPDAAAARAPARSDGADVTTIAEHRRRSAGSARRRRWMWPAAAAAAFVLGIGMAGSVPWSRAPDEEVAMAEMHQIMEVAAAPDAHVMDMEVTGATTKLVVSHDMDKGAVLANDLPMPAKGREYHLWTVMDDRTMQSAATFVPDEDGQVATMMDTGVRGASAFMLTVEEPGTPQPTTLPIAEVTT